MIALLLKLRAKLLSIIVELTWRQEIAKIEGKGFAL
jgi:hypothetical protein